MKIECTPIEREAIETALENLCCAICKPSVKEYCVQVSCSCKPEIEWVNTEKPTTKS